MLLRSTAGWIFRSDSNDGGHRWCAAYRTSLPNNNSGIDLASLPNGSLALCYNPVDTSWGKRTPLVISFSRDNGANWGDTIVLEDEDPPVDEQRIKLDRAYRPNEFSYPAIVSRANQLFACYTWKRKRICFRTVSIEDHQ